MGSGRSRPAGPRQSITLPEAVEPEDYDAYLFSLWPNLEDQLTQSYLCHDLGSSDAVPYDVLEPVLRHHLMQCGLIEYVVRFCNSEGRLETSAIAPYLKDYGLSLNKPLTMEGWKQLCLCWLQKVQDAQADDVATWQGDIKTLQHHRTVDYKRSMELFQSEYVTAIKAYYKSIETEYNKEQQQRKDWEKSQKIQEEFYSDQMGFCQRANDEAIRTWRETLSKQKTASQEYMKQLAPRRITHKLLTFAYQLATDGKSTAGPISGGCRTPENPRRKKIVVVEEEEE